MGEWLADFHTDRRRGVRLLRKSPGFTAAAVLTLALGIGATTAIFSVLHSVVLRPLPFPNPDQLVWIEEVNQRDGRTRPPTTEANAAFREESHAFADVGVGVTGFVEMSVSGPAGATRIALAGIALDTLQVLGTRPVLGRWFTRDEVTVEGDTAATIVISYGLWQSQFGGDPDVVGKTIPGWDAAWGRTIIGVMPPDFWVDPGIANVKGWFAFNVARIPGARPQTIARLAPGANVAQAAAELNVVAKRIEASAARGAADADDWRVRLRPLHEVVAQGYKETLYLLLGAVAFVLLIAAVNVANLQLSRSVTRESEMATRVALGAGRSRLVRQLLTENLVLALVGGVLGIGVAYIGVWVFMTLAPGFYPSQDIGIRPAVLLFTLGVSVLTGLLAGLFPALRVSSPRLHDAMKSSARGGASGIRQGMRRALVVVEVGMALVLLVGAGLMINSYARLMNVDMGFKPDQILAMEINLSGLNKYRTRHNVQWFSVTPQVAVFQREVLERIRTLPGVKSVGATSGLPPRQSITVPFRIVGQTGDASDTSRNAQYYEVSADYFDALGVAVARGRRFTETDSETARWVAVVNEAFARQYFGGTNPVGQILEARINENNRSLADDRPREIVGVVADTRMRLRDDPKPMIYVPFEQHLTDYAGTGEFYLDARKDFAIRTQFADPSSVAKAVRQIVADVDSSVAVDNVTPMADRLFDSAANDRFWLRLLGLFGGLAVFLATVGIYGVIAYAVEQRAHEFSIRTALGAGRRDIVRLVVREGLIVTLVGIAIGLGAAFGLTRLIASKLYGVTPMDPLTIAVVVLFLTAVAVLACVIPARHAAAANPLRALRVE